MEGDKEMTRSTGGLLNWIQEQKGWGSELSNVIERRVTFVAGQMPIDRKEMQNSSKGMQSSY